MNRIPSNEGSIQIDSSKLIIEWVRREGHALVDMNLYPKPVEKHNVTVCSFSRCPSPTLTLAQRNRKDVDESAKDALTYVWDNFIQ